MRTYSWRHDRDTTEATIVVAMKEPANTRAYPQHAASLAGCSVPPKPLRGGLQDTKHLVSVAWSNTSTHAGWATDGSGDSTHVLQSDEQLPQ